jgi:pimeloyl-ACP methyl ester carboxylesterase
VRRLAARLAGLVVLLALIAWTAPSSAAPSAYRGYVDGPWGQIHYRVQGWEGQPTVILLHKMVWSSVEFEKAQPALAARGVRSIAVDLPGYGLSDGPDHEPTAAEYVDALLPVLDRFHIIKANILGVHTGASLAVAFGQHRPDRVARLIIEGPPLMDAKTLRALIQAPPVDRTPAPDGSHFARRWAQIAAGLPKGSVSDASMHQAVMQFFIAAPHDEYAHNAVFKYDLRAGLRALKAPVLLLTNPGDVLYPYAREAKAMRPDFSYVEVDWPGAQDAYDNPAGWAAAVAAYLKY